MKKRWLLAPMTSLLLSGAAWPQDVNSANFIVDNVCKAESDLSCIAWIMGALNGFLTQALISHSPLAYCQPNGVTFGQQREIFLKYLRDNPEHLHENAAGLLYYSQIAAFPCPQPRKDK
jgi:hypothetical protein